MKKLLLAVAAGVAWFLPTHLAILGLLVYLAATAMVSTTNTAKTRALETRVNGVVTAVGAATTTANNAMPKSGGTFSGDVTIGGSLTVNNNLGVHGGTTLVGDSSCGGAWSTNTSSGSTTAFGAEGVHGNLTVLGTINGASIPSPPPSSAPAPPNGTATGPTYAGNFYTGSGAHTWAQNISDKVDQVISSLISAGIYS